MGDDDSEPTPERPSTESRRRPTRAKIDVIQMLSDDRILLRIGGRLFVATPLDL